MAPVSTSELKAIRAFLDMLKAKQIRIEQAYWFGSRARGEGDSWSDWDVAVVSPDLTGIRYDDREKIIYATPKADSHIEVHPFRPEDFTEDNPFAVEIMRTGIRLQ